MEDNLVMTETEMEDSWDDIDFSDLTDEEAGEEPEEETEDTVEEDEGTEAPEADQQTEAEEQTTDSYTLKYMGEEKAVTREEVVTLAQKGMDYDRVKGKLQEIETNTADYAQVKADLAKRNEQFRFMDELAKSQGMSVDELIDSTQASIMAQKTGKDIEVCRGIVANERRARELQAQQAAVTSTKDQQAKKDADIAEFLAAYPELKDPKEVPDEVWVEVNKGANLLNTYRAFLLKQKDAEIERLKAEAAEEKRKQENRSRSTGSLKTKGSKTEDPFDAIWYNGD